MGGVCSGGMMKGQGFEVDDTTFSGKLTSARSFEKPKDNNPYPSYQAVEIYEKNPESYASIDLHMSISRELKPSIPFASGSTKVPQMGSFLGRARIAGLERAVDVLDTLGSSVTNLNSNSGFISGMGLKNNKICILAFEIANTIAKGANLMQSLSEENVQFLKKEILHSDGVQRLVSTDMKELLSIAATDKREEFEVFSREVIRFGNRCKDPQWHNLGRFFSILDSDHALHRQEREGVEKTIQHLTTLAHHTSELYHEYNSLLRFEEDLRRKVDEVESLNLPRKGEGVMMLQSELKHQRKLVRSLRRKSLWSKSLEEVVEKLVDIVTFIHQEIHEAFEDNGMSQVGSYPSKKHDRLGVAGLALHYANIINQIDNIASRPMSLPPNMRDTLYQSLPNSVKSSLRPRCQTVDKELTVPQIKAEMEKTLKWLVPVATNTTKAHQGFGWVGEWANTGNDVSKKGGSPNSLIRIQTLYHANMQKMDQHILELVTLLHQLIGSVRKREHGVIRTQPGRSPTCKIGAQKQMTVVVVDDSHKNLLEEMIRQTRKKKKVYGRSKSLNYGLPCKRGTKLWGPPNRSAESSPKRMFNLDRTNPNNILDVYDGLDTKFHE
ncbi:protein PSK SIMULATOR 2-like [Impatiens glandulifera]|uniref:protein PSK SIMULATOR 2-like n=1 Tax=Impatiens glandulifera TaxID=253017 RepID=UPI001FB138B2|nr:protein PSK SIMULATOR 2-like [Impatiens glandulifera]